MKWTLNFYNNIKQRKITSMTSFYLLPSIEYFRDTTFDEDGDCSFDICIMWFFWGITISRYWGSVYEQRHK